MQDTAKTHPDHSHDDRRHPLFAEAVRAAHTRPAMPLACPGAVYQAVLLVGEGETPGERDSLRALAHRDGLWIQNQSELEMGMQTDGCRLKWERHTEFITLTAYDQSNGQGRYLFDRLLADLLASGSHGQLYARTRLQVIEAGDTDAVVRATFGVEPDIRVAVDGSAATLWTDLNHHGVGWTEYVIATQDAAEAQLGRLVQRLLEVETYRLLCYLAVPMLRDLGERIGRIDVSVTALAERCATNPTPNDERDILDSLTTLSAELQTVASDTEFRFAASLAYSAIVRERLDDIRELREEGYLRLSSAVRRRMDPAMRSCEALLSRQNKISERIRHITDLLSTRVDLALQGQNAAVLRSIDKRADAQLRLQQTVEGLSVVAISYYSLGLLSYLFKGADGVGLPVSGDTLLSILTLPIALLIYLGVRRIRDHFAE